MKIMKLLTVAIMLFLSNMYCAKAEDLKVKIINDVNLSVPKPMYIVKGKINKGKYANKEIEGNLNIGSTNNNLYNVTINWYSLKMKPKEQVLSGVSSNQELDLGQNKTLKKGTTLSIVGDLAPKNQSNNIDDSRSSGKDGEQNQDKSPDTLSNTSAEKSNASNGDGGNNWDMPDWNKPDGGGDNPDWYNPDGGGGAYNPEQEDKVERVFTSTECPLAIDSEKGTATILVKEYERNVRTGKYTLVKDCYKTELVKPIIYEECPIQDDFNAGKSYARQRGYILDDSKDVLADDPTIQGQGTKRTAIDCIPIRTYEHMFEVNNCRLEVNEHYYTEKGQLYYTNDKLEKVYVTDCITNPKDAQAKELSVDYDSCDINHLYDQNRSIYFGKYYYIDKENKKVILAYDCQHTYLSDIGHTVEFVRWENFDNDRYAKKWEKTYIKYPQNTWQYTLHPNENIYITGDKVNATNYPYKPISIESRVTSKETIQYLGTYCSVGWNYGKPLPTEANSPKPNPTAVFKREVISECQAGGGGDSDGGGGGHTGDIQYGKKIKFYWLWQDTRKECMVTYKRPDDTIMKYNDWTPLTDWHWDQNVAINAICK